MPGLKEAGGQISWKDPLSAWSTKNFQIIRRVDHQVDKISLFVYSKILKLDLKILEVWTPGKFSGLWKPWRRFARTDYSATTTMPRLHLSLSKLEGKQSEKLHSSRPDARVSGCDEQRRGITKKGVVEKRHARCTSEVLSASHAVLVARFCSAWCISVPICLRRRKHRIQWICCVFQNQFYY